MLVVRRFMAYQPIRSSADLAARLIPGATREDHWLDFKGLNAANAWPYRDNDNGRDECRLDVAAFANEDGGSIVIGAEEVEAGHVFARFTPVPNAQERLRGVDEILKEKLEPRPAIEPYVLQSSGEEEVIVINIPPSLRLIALHSDDWYTFPVRTADSRRYLALAEVDARMQDRDRVHRLRLHQIPREAPVGLDAKVDSQLSHDNWRIGHVEEDVVILTKVPIEVPVPLAYVETVYKAGLPSAEWVIALSCYVNRHRHRAIVTVTKEMPFGRNAGHYRSRGLEDEG